MGPVAPRIFLRMLVHMWLLNWGELIAFMPVEALIACPVKLPAAGSHDDLKRMLPGELRIAMSRPSV